MEVTSSGIPATTTTDERRRTTVDASSDRQEMPTISLHRRRVERAAGIPFVLTSHETRWSAQWAAPPPPPPPPLHPPLLTPPALLPPIPHPPPTPHHPPTPHPHLLAHPPAYETNRRSDAAPRGAAWAPSGRLFAAAARAQPGTRAAGRGGSEMTVCVVLCQTLGGTQVAEHCLLVGRREKIGLPHPRSAPCPPAQYRCWANIVRPAVARGASGGSPSTQLRGAAAVDRAGLEGDRRRRNRFSTLEGQRRVLDASRRGTPAEGPERARDGAANKARERRPEFEIRPKPSPPACVVVYHMQPGMD